MPRRKAQPGRDFAPQHVIRQQMMHRGDVNTLALPRYPGFSSRPHRMFYQNPHAAGGENQRRIRQRVLGEHERVKQQNRFSRFGHRHSFQTPYGFRHRPMAPMIPRRQPVFPLRRPFGFMSPLHRRIPPMYPMNPFQSRGLFPPRGPNLFHHPRYDPRHQGFRRRPFEDDECNDEDGFIEVEDGDSDFLDEFEEDDDDNYFSEYSTGFDSGDDDDEYDDEWSSRRTYQPHSGYGHRW